MWRFLFLIQILLDSSDPAAIPAINEKMNFEVTLFVFASKTGKRIEYHTLLLYFLERLKAHGRTDPGRCFIAVTEEGSYLASHAKSYGIPVLLSTGPRYLHYFEQVYKGGPEKGLFLILTGEPTEEIVIPGAGYTFGQLQLALAQGDFESLELRHKLVIRVHLAQGLEAGLGELEQAIQQALEDTRTPGR
jgi:hypothetical protein